MKFRIIASLFVILILLALYVLLSGGTSSSDTETPAEEQVQ